MYRFAIIGCSVVMLGSTAVAFAADAKSITEESYAGKSVAGKSVLAKHGLTEFDRDGNGILDADERAAAYAARRAARSERPVSTYTSASEYPSFIDLANVYVAPRSFYTHHPGGLLITPTNSAQTVSAFCRRSGQYQSITVSPAGIFPGASPVVR